MEQDFNEKHWSNPCPKYDCRKNACKCGLKYVNIPVGLEDEFKPTNGAYCNAIVEYEGTGEVYIYSKEGVPVLVEKTGQSEPESAVHLSIVNAPTATWNQLGKEGESSGSAGWDKGAVASSDVLFQTDDGTNMSTEQLYSAVAKGQKFTIDVPFGEISTAASMWDMPVSIDTAQSIEFNTQVNTLPSLGPQTDVTAYISSAIVLCQGYGIDVVPYVLPFGMFEYGGEYVFFVTIMGRDDN